MLFVLQAVAATSKAFVFDAEPSTADVVLKKIAKQSDTQILFPLEQLRSIKANGIRGEYSLGEALELALQGTGLKAELLQSGAIVVSFASDRKPQRGNGEMKRSFWSALVALFGGVATLPSPIMAQESLTESAPSPSAPATDDNVQTVVVTGSLIKRNKDSSQLVTNLDAEELRLRGATNATDILSAVSQNQLAASPNDGARTSSLTTLANLRSLGTENTLVLINGKRMVNNPIFDNGVDLNTVPTALIDSVDVLSDGASSIYGSDAVAGVINFRTKDSFQGFQSNLHALFPQHENGELRAASVAAGLGALSENRWNFVAAVTWRERLAIRTVDRDFSKTSLIADRGVNNLLTRPFPANLRQDGTVSGVNPFPACFPPNTVPTGDGGCLLDSDAAGLIDLQNPEKQKSAYSRLSTLLGEQKLSVEYLWAESSNTNALTGTTIFGYEMPNTSPYYPGNGIVPAVAGLDTSRSIIVDTRFTPSGRRTTQNLSDTDRILAQLEGKVGGVDYEVWALRSTSTARLNALRGALLISGINDGLAGANGAPFINPFGEQSPEAAAYLRSIEFRGTMARGVGTLTMAGATLSKEIFNLPAGPVSTALAFEHGRDTFEYGLNPLNNLLEGAVPGNAVQALGDRARYSGAAEVLIPIVHGLDANASVRMDHYSDFGNTTNPKLLLSYDVTSFMNLHASFNKGFRAPPLPKLLAPQTLGLVSGLRNDPLLCPGGVADTAAGGVFTRDCQVAFNSLSGGNPDLQPQRSKAYAVGFNLRLRDALPLGTAAFSVDYWNYELNETIGILSTAAIFGNPTRFSSYLVRCSQADPLFKPHSDACNFGGPGDPIAYVGLNNANVGTTKTSGFDVTANWSFDMRYGSLAFGYRGTYITQYDYTQLPGDPFLSRRGIYRDGFPVIPYSHYLTLGWGKGAWSANLQNRLKGGYDDCNAACINDPQFFDHVGTYSLWNLATTYTFSEALAVTFHVDNLFDTDPPFTNQNDGNCTGCDVRFADPTGRAFALTFVGKLGFAGNR